MCAFSGEEHEFRPSRCMLFRLFESFCAAVLGEAVWWRCRVCEAPVDMFKHIYEITQEGHIIPLQSMMIQRAIAKSDALTGLQKPSELARSTSNTPSPTGRPSCKTNTVIVSVSVSVKENKLVLSGWELWCH